jgi:hypothetical protein
MHPDLTLGIFLLCRFWTLVIFSPAVTVTSSMSSIEETMMRMSYSQRAANLDGREVSFRPRWWRREQCRSSGRDDWPVRIASSCRRQPQKSIVLSTLASKITNNTAQWRNTGAHRRQRVSGIYTTFRATRGFTAIALVF